MRRRTGRESWHSTTSSSRGIDASAVVALNRAVAVALISGPAAGMAAVRWIENAAQLEGYYLYFAVLGVPEFRQGNREQAEAHFRRALGLTDLPAERAFLAAQIRDCGHPRGGCQHVDLLPPALGRGESEHGCLRVMLRLPLERPLPNTGDSDLGNFGFVSDFGFRASDFAVRARRRNHSAAGCVSPRDNQVGGGMIFRANTTLT